MKTDELIKILQADAQRQAMPMPRAWGVATLLAVLAAGIVFATLLHPRLDIADVAGSARFLFKFLFAGALAGAAFVALRSAARPDAGRHLLRWLLIAPALLLVAAGLELIAVPPGAWMSRMVGQNNLACMFFIPVIGILPLGLFLLALRHGAPADAMLAGALAGLASGGLAALFYALHCRDDSPLFVAVWYSIAVLILAALGAVGGRLFARW
jgi:hypothetical protein